MKIKELLTFVDKNRKELEENQDEPFYVMDQEGYIDKARGLDYSTGESLVIIA